MVFSASIAPTPTNDVTIDPSTGAISWVSDCADIVGDDLTAYVVTVTVDDGCEPVSDSFTITLDPEICLCTLSLQVKEGGSFVEYLDSLSPTEYADLINPLLGYTVTVGNNASRLWFRICAPTDATTVYNYYRGGSCGSSWDFDDLSGDEPPSWSGIIPNNQYYPADYPSPGGGMLVCNDNTAAPKNIIMVMVTEADLTVTIYRINVYR